MNNSFYFLNEFTYSKRIHFEIFNKCKNDIELFKYKIDPDNCDLKVYQDLLVFYLLKRFLKPGFKILEIGGGNSRIIEFLKNQYEFWNLDKLEGLGNGPKNLEVNGFNLIQDYIGNFNNQLPDNYFDIVFSISALEHIPLDESTDKKIYLNTLSDINRLMCDNGLSIHCIDHTTDLLYDTEEELWTNPFITFLYENEKILNDFVNLKVAENDPDLFCVSESFYNLHWKPVTGKDYCEFGKPFSYNIFWKKS